MIFARGWAYLRRNTLAEREKMRVMRLPGLVHILALAVLLIAALPFAGADGAGARGAHSDAHATVMADCDMQAEMAAGGAGCRGMAMHCLSLVVPEPAPTVAATGLVLLHHPLVAISATSRAPEAQSPPPRA